MTSFFYLPVSIVNYLILKSSLSICQGDIMLFLNESNVLF